MACCSTMQTVRRCKSSFDSAKLTIVSKMQPMKPVKWKKLLHLALKSSSCWRRLMRVLTLKSRPVSDSALAPPARLQKTKSSKSCSKRPLAIHLNSSSFRASRQMFTCTEVIIREVFGSCGRTRRHRKIPERPPLKTPKLRA